MESEQESVWQSLLYTMQSEQPEFSTPPLATQIGFRPAASEPLRPIPLVRFLIWALCGGCQTNGPLAPQPNDATYVAVFPMMLRVDCPTLRTETI